MTVVLGQRNSAFSLHQVESDIIHSSRVRLEQRSDPKVLEAWPIVLIPNSLIPISTF
jgi:hypothetical protein